jgi:hypothetical protein
VRGLLIALSAILFASIATARPNNGCRKWFRDKAIDYKSRSCFEQCFLAQNIMEGTCHFDCDVLCEPDTKIWLYFGNGMFNSVNDAQFSLDSLKAQLYPFLEKKYPEARRFLAGPTTARIAYNTNEPVLEQLLQVIDHKMGHHYDKLFLYLSGGSMAPDWFYGAVREVSKRFNRERLLHDVDLKTQVQEYQSRISKQDAVLVVAHSQGNLYLDEAFSHLEQSKAPGLFGSVSVATPAEVAPRGKTAAGEWYVTLSSDSLIRAIPAAMPANVTNKPAGLFDHFFVDHYLNGDASGPMILEEATCVLSQLNQSIMTPLNTKMQGCRYEDDEVGD